jgi:competence protein ComEC
MAGVAIAGELLGRRGQALVSLAFVSLLMTAWNPLLLAGVSYQLSFAATLALIVVEPRLAQGAQAWLATHAGAPRARRWTRVLRDFALATLAAQILTLPLIWHHFGQVSLLSLPANVLVLPAQPPAMALGALAAGLGLVWPAAGQAVGALAWPLLRYSIAVVQALAALPSAAATGAALPGLAMASIYLAVAVWPVPPAVCVRALSRAREALGRLAVALRARRRGLWGLGLLLAVAIWAALAGLPDGRTHVYFLDVGQGDAILIRGPTGRTALVDGGADPVLLASRLGKVLPFWQRRIDVVAVTHADSDHLAGLVPLVGRYRVGHVLEPPAMSTEEAAAAPVVASWHAALAEAGLTPQVASAGMEIRLDRDLTLAVLHPAAGMAGGETDDNRHSLVLRVQADAQRILLAADIDAVAEAGLLESGADVRAALLKVAHHGAATGSSAEFLAAVAPAAAVISVGAGNRFGHPAEETLARLAAAGAAVYRTDQVGVVEVVTDGERLWLRVRRQRDAESDGAR